MTRLYTIQSNLKLGDVEGNIETIYSYLREAQDGIALIPEMFSCGFDNENLKKHAQKTKQIKKQLQRISLENNLVIAGTLPEIRAEHELVYNVGFILDKGKLIYERGKNKLFKFTNEHKYFAQGENNFNVVVSSFGKLGLIICFELRFPEIAIELRKKEVEIILVPAQWGKARTDHFRTLLKARAIETQSFVMSSDTVGMIDTEYAGHSSIYDPLGRELICAGDKEGMFSADIKLSEVYKSRNTLPID